ncbi:caspase-1-like isoform X1 [Myotis myotis]|uniref:caspase-1-like isoform X1 n=1 Tax=Myotis myotis TaxID=51298 RepID=UPI00174CABD0|nr:caspase-1-like isoform X1 [Myotis myotis]XP_036180320.1 caspase-1-like isoform X1 [Myotis myotis]XP_036180321.1 caspase-1-like isoform X1 [Myotis myotis]
MADKDLKEKRKVFIQSVTSGTINGLLDDLLKERVLNQEEMEKVRCENATDMDKARALIDSVTRKGDKASQVCIHHIREIDSHLAEKMGLPSVTGPCFPCLPISPLCGRAATRPLPREEDISPSSLPAATDPAVPPEVTGPAESAETTDTLKLCPPEEFLKVCQERAGEIYPIKERTARTRLALIICNREFDHLQPRKGAELDITGMRELLVGLDYSVIVKENLTAKEMEKVLVEFAACTKHWTSDSTFLVFMSHGLLDRLCGTQHSDENPDVLSYDTIFRIFNNRNCPSLKDKPKVIIVQACRGENRGELWVSDSPAAVTDSSSQSPENLEEDAVHKAHVEKDFIAFFSSTPHNVSLRDTSKGSLFITQLIRCFQIYSWHWHLEEVFRKVQLSFEKPDVRAQMPTIERLSMSRYFYLFPGN